MGEAKFKDSKFIIRNKEEYDKLMKALYSVGCQWKYRPHYSDSMKYKDDIKFIFVRNDNEITWSDSDNSYIHSSRTPVAIQSVLDYVEEMKRKANNLDKLKPFDKILVVWSGGYWRPAFFGGRNAIGRVITTGQLTFKAEDVIPYDGNEGLANTLVCQD